MLSVVNFISLLSAALTLKFSTLSFMKVNGEQAVSFSISFFCDTLSTHVRETKKDTQSRHVINISVTNFFHSILFHWRRKRVLWTPLEYAYVRVHKERKIPCTISACNLQNRFFHSIFSLKKKEKTQRGNFPGFHTFNFRCNVTEVSRSVKEIRTKWISPEIYLL